MRQQHTKGAHRRRWDVFFGQVQVWDNMVVMQHQRPVSGNLDGSYLTMFSSSGLIFGVLQVSVLFGGVLGIG